MNTPTNVLPFIPKPGCPSIDFTAIVNSARRLFESCRALDTLAMLGEVPVKGEAKRIYLAIMAISERAAEDAEALYLELAKHEPIEGIEEVDADVDDE